MEGVSTTRMFLPFHVPVAAWHVLVTVWAPSLDSNTRWPRTLFPVALFPQPDLPTRTILSKEEEEDEEGEEEANWLFSSLSVKRKENRIKERGRERKEKKLSLSS